MSRLFVEDHWHPATHLRQHVHTFGAGDGNRSSIATPLIDGCMKPRHTLCAIEWNPLHFAEFNLLPVRNSGDQYHCHLAWYSHRHAIAGRVQETLFGKPPASAI
jgi:hypothetical protein